jgi:hypothetical protein
VLRFLADENFNRFIVRGLRRREPDLDVARVQDVGLSGADDPAILASAARDGRLVLTHDVSTVTRYAYERAAAGLSMPGVCEVRRSAPVGRAIEDILLLAMCSHENEWEGQVIFLPFAER